MILPIAVIYPTSAKLRPRRFHHTPLTNHQSINPKSITRICDILENTMTGGETPPANNEYWNFSDSTSECQDVH
jgi:hypothetical protein